MSSVYADLTSGEIAEVIEQPDTAVRKQLSNYGIECPRMVEARKRRNLFERFWMHGEPKTICQYLGLSMPAFRMRVKRMGLKTNQTELPL